MQNLSIHKLSPTDHPGSLAANKIDFHQKPVCNRIIFLPKYHLEADYSMAQCDEQKLSWTLYFKGTYKFEAPTLNETHSKGTSVQVGHSNKAMIWGFNVIAKTRAYPGHTGLWMHALAVSHLSPRQGRGRSHSYLPIRHPMCSNILPWWRWGPARYHRDWHHWDYSSILSFLPWVDPRAALDRVEKVKCTLVALIRPAQNTWADIWVYPRHLLATKLLCTIGLDSSMSRYGCTWILNFARFLSHPKGVNLSKQFPFTLTNYFILLNLAVSSFHICLLARHRPFFTEL